MSNGIFQFKKFSIRQDQTAMKVGTDGVLLGAWANLQNARNILDIGTGTGLIALMAAQRNSQAKITAIEINSKAAMQARNNFVQSPWRERLYVLNVDFQQFKTNEKFDYIISNPPYFEEKTLSPDAERNTARHTDYLPLKTLLTNASDILAEDGLIGLILPYQAYPKLLSIIDNHKLFVKRLCKVKGNAKTKTKRILVELTDKKCIMQEEELVIEITRHNYTEAYKKLTKDFYLKL